MGNCEPLAHPAGLFTVWSMDETRLRQLIEKRDSYAASANEAAGSAAALALLQRSLLTTLEGYDLSDSTEALAGAAVAVDHVLRCMHVANIVASEVANPADIEIAQALQAVTRGCLAADASLLLELLEYRV